MMRQFTGRSRVIATAAQLCLSYWHIRTRRSRSANGTELTPSHVPHSISVMRNYILTLFNVLSLLGLGHSQTPCECPSGWTMNTPIVQEYIFPSTCEIDNIDCRMSILARCCIDVPERRVVVEIEDGLIRVRCDNIPWDERLRQQNDGTNYMICKDFWLGPCSKVICSVNMKTVVIVQTAECGERRRSRILEHTFRLGDPVCTPYGIGNCPCDDTPVVVPLPEATPIYPIIWVV